jgi:SM-20-related protein
MLSEYFALNIDDQLNKIAEHGFCVMDNFISNATVLALSNEINELHDGANMHEAGTGQKFIAVNSSLRGDSIYWLNEAVASVAQQVYYEQMEALRVGLNQHLYLGLFSLESHLALYPIGAGYKKHIDRFRCSNDSQKIDTPIRQISCILYLNEDWLESDGGHLRLYVNPLEATANSPARLASAINITPMGGRLVMFLSDTFYHEVLPATRDRKSLTGWFLTR